MKIRNRKGNKIERNERNIMKEENKKEDKGEEKKKDKKEMEE